MALILSLLLAASAGPEAEVTALLTEFLAKVDDPAMHERFWADDLIYTSAKGVVRSKAEILAAMRAEKPDKSAPKETYDAEDVKVRAFAPGVAVLNFRLVRHAGAETSYFRNSGTFVKRKGRWQAVSWQATAEQK